MLNCRLCASPVSRQDLEGHLRQDLGYAPFVCLLCRMQFFSRGDAQLHFVGRTSPHPGARPRLAELKDPALEPRLEALLAHYDSLPPPTQDARALTGQPEVNPRKQSDATLILAPPSQLDDVKVLAEYNSTSKQPTALKSEEENAGTKQESTCSQQFCGKAPTRPAEDTACIVLDCSEQTSDTSNQDNAIPLAESTALAMPLPTLMQETAPNPAYPTSEEEDRKLNEPAIVSDHDESYESFNFSLRLTESSSIEISTAHISEKHNASAADSDIIMYMSEDWELPSLVADPEEEKLKTPDVPPCQEKEKSTELPVPLAGAECSITGFMDIQDISEVPRNKTKCEKCNGYYGRTLLDHASTQHLKKPIFTCKLCPYFTFLWANNLLQRDHIRRKHNIDKKSQWRGFFDDHRESIRDEFRQCLQECYPRREFPLLIPSVGVKKSVQYLSRNSIPQGHMTCRLCTKVRVSQQNQAQYYQAGHLQAGPPGVRVQLGGRPVRSSSAERNRGARIIRQPASSPALRSQGANVDLRPHYSYQLLLQQQQLMYERRLDLAAEDPMGAFREEDPWTLVSPALPRRHPSEPDSPSSTSTDSAPSMDTRSPRIPRNQSAGGGRLVSGPIRRTSESPITVIRTASAASTASSASSSSRQVASQGIRCCQVGPSSSGSPVAVDREKELRRKRQYRIALNFFNKKPERGMELLVQWGFTEGDPGAVAKFLLTRRGLSKQMIGDYLGQLGNPFAQAVLSCFVDQVPMGGLCLDEALRHFLSLFRLPGEAQKIERIIQIFASHYSTCNRESVFRIFREADTVFVLAFAIIMLNTDLHTPNLKDDKRMKLDDFLKNLRGIDAGEDIDRDYIRGIYERVKETEFRPGSDHLTQVLRVDRSILPCAKKPSLALPHRRLVCYCRLYEVEDPGKKQTSTVHQRELFLFNDLLVVTKILGKGKRPSAVSYNFRQAHSLVGLTVHGFRNQYYPYGLRMNLTHEGKTLHFHARSEDDRTKFMEDLREATLESEEMEALRIELELEKQALIRPPNTHSLNRSEVQRDSGLPELEERPLRHRALSSSTLELAGTDHPPPPVPRHLDPERRLSLNSDSGMSSTASVGSRESSPKTGPGAEAKKPSLSALFGK